jgi:hypothetical protein
MSERFFCLHAYRQPGQQKKSPGGGHANLFSRWIVIGIEVLNG